MKQQYHESEEQKNEDLPSIIDILLNIPVRDSRGFFLNSTEATKLCFRIFGVIETSSKSI